MKPQIISVGSRLPIIILNPSMMPLPQTMLWLDIRLVHADFLTAVLNQEIQFVVMLMERVSDNKLPLSERLYGTGVICSIELLNNNGANIFSLKGIHRARISDITPEENKSYSRAAIKEFINDTLDDFFEKSQEGEEIIVKPDFQLYSTSQLLSLKFNLETLATECTDFIDPATRMLSYIIGDMNILEFESRFYFREVIDEFIWRIIYAIPILSGPQKQVFIEETSLIERFHECTKLLLKNIAITQEAKKNGGVAATGNQVTPVTGKNETNNDDFINGANPEIIERWKEYQKIADTLNPDVRDAFRKDFQRLKSGQPGQADWQVFITHLDYLLKLYSIVDTPQETDIDKAEERLQGSHYGLDKPTNRILDYIATRKRNPKAKAPILCFVGPPGVGKTSLGQAIASSLDLEFARASLGGVKDEAEIRGHRATYIGALPGMFVRELISKDSRILVFMLDEIDKISSDFRGDPSSALLEVLDPEQNHSFVDHYIDAPLDLSGVLFLCTANVAANIQPALLSRMEVIDISGYTVQEKIEISKKFLISKQIIEEGLTGINIRYQDDDPDKIISTIISRTREAGVRNLEREIKTIFSKWGRKYIRGAEDKRPTELLLTAELLEELLGLARNHERVNITEIGEAVGLAWTEFGGEIMYIHAELTPHGRTEKDISQTGNLSKIFQEANHNSLTVIKNLLRNNKDAMDRLKENLLCLSVPDLAIEKDGPSAGITMATAIYSELTDGLCEPYLAMTGELTIKGRVRAIGGVKEKVLAAHRDGLKKLIFPVSNRRNIEKDVPDDIKNELKFHYVERIEEVIEIALTKETPA